MLSNAHQSDAHKLSPQENQDSLYTTEGELYEAAPSRADCRVEVTSLTALGSGDLEKP